MMTIPDKIKEIMEKVESSGFEIYIVGGCVRDFLMERKIDKKIEDWDLTTNAKPEEILKLFEDAKYENKFGTVLLPIKNEEGKTELVVEITTYRSEHGYSDHRRPDEVVFEEDLDKDLERRDFTVNALAMNLRGEIVDLFGGEKDIKKRIIRAVGEPSDRFKEDALRMMRAIRFACQLGFEIEPKTERGILKLAGSIKFIAKERIGEELKKIMKSEKAYAGIMYLHKTKLLQYIMPELESGIGISQNHHHVYTIFEHNTLSLKYCPSKDWRVRMAALLHDVGKVQTKKRINGIWTFYNHEYVSEKITRKIMRRLKFSNDDINKVTNLVRNHMFYYNVDEVTAASVRRLIKKVGKENLKDLIDMRIGDRLGSGVKKAKPYKLRHLEYMFDRVQNDPVSVKMLKINGDILMKELGMEPGPKIGAILDTLLSEVIEDTELNNLDYLMKRSKELDKIDIEELRESAKELIEEKRQEDDRKMRRGHKVK